MRFGMEAMEELAIEEWRGASPVYGDRLRQVMDVEGDGVVRHLQGAPARSRVPAPLHGRPLRDGRRAPRLLRARLLRGADGRRAVRRAHGDQHVPPHRGRDVRRDRPGGQPQGPHPPRPPAARGSRRTVCRTAAGRSSSTTTPRPCPRRTSPTITRMTTAATFAFPPHEGRHAPRARRADAAPTAGSRRPDRSQRRRQRQATRRRLSERQAEVDGASGGRGGDEVQAARSTTGSDGPHDRPARRRGAGHRLHLLLLQGPPAGRGPLAPAARRCPPPPIEPTAAGRSSGWPACCGTLGLVMADDPAVAAAVHHGAPGRGPRREARCGTTSAPTMHQRLRPPSVPAPTERCCAALELTYIGAMLRPPAWATCRFDRHVPDRALADVARARAGAVMERRR